MPLEHSRCFRKAWRWMLVASPPSSSRRFSFRPHRVGVERARGDPHESLVSPYRVGQRVRRVRRRSQPWAVEQVVRAAGGHAAFARSRRQCGGAVGSVGAGACGVCCVRGCPVCRGFCSVDGVCSPDGACGNRDLTAIRDANGAPARRARSHSGRRAGPGRCGALARHHATRHAPSSCHQQS